MREAYARDNARMHEGEYMTRKDFELIAKALAQPIEAFDTAAESHAARCAWAQTCTNVAEALRSTNQRFDFERFLKACGVVD